MLHRVPLRRTRTSELLLCLLCLAAVAAVLTLFFALYAANWDVVLLHLFALVMVSLPLPPLLLCFWGTRTLQVEHAGVVMGTYAGKHLVRLQVWRAEQVRAFDWEQQSDGGYSLRLLIRRTPAQQPSFVTVLHTDSPYQLAAVWRDLELHYPGSAWRPLTAPPEQTQASVTMRRRTGFVVLLAALALAAGTWRSVAVPLAVSAFGRTTPAVVTALRWDTPVRSGDYHLEVLPAGAEQTRLSATAFPQQEPMPQVGQTLAVVWADAYPYFYTTAEVLPMLMPLCCSGAVLMLAALGLAALRRC